MCFHKKTIDDDREGTEVCLDCGLVLQEILLPGTPLKTTRTFSTREGEPELTRHLCDVIAHAEIPMCVVSPTLDYYKQLRGELASHRPKFTDKVLLAYALYETLNRENISRTVQEIAFFTDCSEKKLWNVESALNLEKTLSSPLDYVERYATQVNLTFSDVKKIKEKIGSLACFYSAKPQCVVALALYMHCLENKLKCSLKNICQVCSVSPTNVHHMMRKMKRYKIN